MVNCVPCSSLSSLQTKGSHLLENVGVGRHVVPTILDSNDDGSNVVDIEVAGTIQERVDHVKAASAVGTECGCATGHRASLSQDMDAQKLAVTVIRLYQVVEMRPGSSKHLPELLLRKIRAMDRR